MSQKRIVNNVTRRQKSDARRYYLTHSNEQVENENKT
jgi:hypothetical protein